VTVVEASVVAKLPVPVPVTSPVRVIVWSPVLVPLILVPVTVPVAATELGVIAPSDSVIAGVVVEVATLPLTPLAVTTETELTVPDPLPGVYPSAVVTSLEVRVTAPVRVLKLDTPPADPLLADVIIPKPFTVIFALVYEPGITPLDGASMLIVPFVVIGLPLTTKEYEVIPTEVTVPVPLIVPQELFVPLVVRYFPALPV
jgi:hypothetical protein